MQSTRPSPDSPAHGAARAALRTCVGCSQEAAATDLVRLVLAVGAGHDGQNALTSDATGAGEGKQASPRMDVVVDASGGTFGRGAHVHATPACVAKAERGLSRNFKRAVRAPGAELAAAIVSALSRRAEGLLGTAHRLRRVEVGADAVLALLQAGSSPLLVVACDAGSVAQSHEVAAMVAKGRVVAWSSRAVLGTLLGRGEVAIFALTDDRLAAAFADAIQTMSVLSPSVVPHVSSVTEEPTAALPPSARAHLPETESRQWKGEACKSPEVR